VLDRLAVRHGSRRVLPPDQRHHGARHVPGQRRPAPGYLVVYPSGNSVPVASTLNYRTAQTRANNVAAALGPSGDIGIHCGQPTGTVQVVIDINGYFQ